MNDQAQAHDAANPGSSSEPVIFETVLVPYRSLPPAGFLLVMGALILVSTAIGVGFTLVGGWPVVGFFGLDILLVYLAFRISYRSARRSEHVRLTGRALEVVFDDGSGHARRAVLQPYWTRLELERVGAKRSRLMLRSHGRALELGGFLGLEQKEDLADALSDALRTARG